MRTLLFSHAAVDINRITSETADIAVRLDVPNDPYFTYQFLKENAFRDSEFLVKFDIEPEAIIKRWGPGVTLGDILRDVENGL